MVFQELNVRDYLFCKKKPEMTIIRNCIWQNLKRFLRVGKNFKITLRRPWRPEYAFARIHKSYLVMLTISGSNNKGASGGSVC